MCVLASFPPQPPTDDHVRSACKLYIAILAGMVDVAHGLTSHVALFASDLDTVAVAAARALRLAVREAEKHVDSLTECAVHGGEQLSQIALLCDLALADGDLDTMVRTAACAQLALHVLDEENHAPAYQLYAPVAVLERAASQLLSSEVICLSTAMWSAVLTGALPLPAK